MPAKIPSDLIIVVGRQFGSGGRAIGKKLAEEFGLEYYDKEMLAKAAEKFGYSQSIFARHDEKRPSALRSLITNAFGVGDSYLQNPMSSESIYRAQSSVIRELARQGGCVFVGRSSDYVLRDFPHLVSIFLSAPIEQRAKLLIKRGDAETPEKAMEIARKYDRNREDYYNYFTGRHWGHSENYHLSLSIDGISTDDAIEVIKAYIGSRFKQWDKP